MIHSSSSSSPSSLFILCERTMYHIHNWIEESSFHACEKISGVSCSSKTWKYDISPSHTICCVSCQNEILACSLMISFFDFSWHWLHPVSANLLRTNSRIANCDSIQSAASRVITHTRQQFSYQKERADRWKLYLHDERRAHFPGSRESLSMNNC